MYQRDVVSEFGPKTWPRCNLTHYWLLSTQERLWQRCLFKYLRCEPEEHHVLLTEPPLNTPENRELTAEIMFETFNVFVCVSNFKRPSIWGLSRSERDAARSSRSTVSEGRRVRV